MRIIIAGGRYLRATGANVALLDSCIRQSGFWQKITVVISGACGIDAADLQRDYKHARGGDGIGEAWAKLNSIPVERFYASWKLLGGAAGPARNQRMVDAADGLVTLPGDSGTGNLRHLAWKAHLLIWPPVTPGRSKDAP